jgi:hypothetical protein
MKTFKSQIKRVSSLFIILFVSISIQSCKSDKKETKNNETAIDSENVIEIITEDMEFQMQDTIPSGWNTFRYKNLSPQTHFFLVERYPEGKSLEDAKAEVIPAFSEGMKLLNEGENEQAMTEFGKLPDWYSEVKFLGGSGLISSEKIGETTIELEPGYYLMECYVKMSNGEFHSSMGMIRDFVVSTENSGNQQPVAGIEIDLSSKEGIVFNDSITVGTHTFSVFYRDQTVHENFVGHDLNLVKLNQNSKVEDLEKWMNWSDPEGLIEPAPEGFTFLGGVNDMAEGSTGFFTATLEAGKYALVSEVPNTIEKKMLKTFNVSDSNK